MNFVRAKLEALTKTLPRDAYCSDEIFALERERIFARAWCCVTREERLSRAGDYVVCEVAGESLIVTRYGAGAVRAYANICRHRGTLFPSLLLSLHADHVMVHTITPLAAGRTRVVYAWLFDPSAIAAPGFDPSDAVDFWDLTNRQDWHVNELTQLGVSSRFHEPGPYANQEGLLAAFDRHYTSTLQAG